MFNDHKSTLLNGQVLFVHPGVQEKPGLLTSAKFISAIAVKPKGLLAFAAVRMPSGGALRFYLVSVSHPLVRLHL